MASVSDALKILERLSAMAGQKSRALEELHALYAARVPWRPEICEALCEQGDTTLLARTLAESPSGEPTYDDLMHPDPEDGARFLNARETLARLRSRFGNLLPKAR